MKVDKKPKWLHWYQIAGLCIIPIVLMFIVWAIVYKVQLEGDFSEIWFGSLNFFSQQSNFIVMSFMILYFFIPNNKMFRNNSFFLISVSYITITSFMFNVLLVPIGFALGIAQTVLADPIPVINTLMLHCVMPIYFILFFIFCYKTKTISYRYEKNYWKYILYGSIYIVCYLFYVFIVPFCTDRVIYTQYSNCNPNMYVVEKGGETGAYGNPLYIFIFIAVYLVFVLSMSSYWLIMRRKAKR